MAAVKNKNTSLELKVRKGLWSRGLRYRLKNNLPGHPDIIFSGRKLAIFCDGCFWHGCPLCKSIPEQNQEFWMNKIDKNIKRDQQVTHQLHEMGWTVKVPSIVFRKFDFPLGS